jgi:hypothetical protein
MFLCFTRGHAATVVDRSSAGQLLAAVSPGLLLPSQHERDYSLLSHHDITTPYK